MDIYRVTITPNFGAEAGKEVEALLLDIAYNPGTNRFQLLFAGVDDRQNALKSLLDTQLTKIVVKGKI